MADIENPDKAAEADVAEIDEDSDEWRGGAVLLDREMPLPVSNAIPEPPPPPPPAKAEQ